MAKKARSKKESTTKKSASIAGVKKSGDKLPPSGFAKNHELYWRTQIDSDLIIEAIQIYYGSFGDVRTTFPEDREYCLTVQLFKNKQAKLPVIEVSQESWADEIVDPDLAHFFGPGKIVMINQQEIHEYGCHEFLYERESSEVLKFDQATAKQCFSHLVEVNSGLLSSYFRPRWWTYSQFNLLIYRLIQIGEANILHDYMKRTELKKEEKASLSSHCPFGVRYGLNEGINYAMLNIYMVSGGDYGDYGPHDKEQEIFYKLMFQEHELDLKLTDAERIAALEAMIDNGGGNIFVEAALSAIHRKRK